MRDVIYQQTYEHPTNVRGHLAARRSNVWPITCNR
jgi:hypothetical protein